jgi:hypothetical protein
VPETGKRARHVRSGAEFLAISHHQRENMRRAKGGTIVDSLLLQEGVHTQDTYRGCVAEPVMAPKLPLTKTNGSCAMPHFAAPQ